MKTLKSIKRFALSAMGVAILLVLSGCVQVDKATGQPTGLIWNTIGAPMAEAIKYFATDKGRGRYYYRNHYRALDYLATWYLPIMEGNASL